MSFSTKLHYLTHAIVATKVARVRRTAIEAGGVVSWSFSQVENPVRSLICTFGETSGGICEMASAKWLECHAKGDHMANWLQKDGTGPIDPNKIRQLMQLFSVGTTMHPDRMRGGSGGGADDQNRATETWLQTKGILRKGGVIGVHFHNLGTVHVPQGSNVARGNRQRRVLARELAEEIVRQPGTYKMIGVTGAHFAHACAAWSQQDVAFFDPNFGEFWFDSREKFVSWFPKFWHTAGYGTPKIGLSEGYETWEYFCPLKKGAA